MEIDTYQKMGDLKDEEQQIYQSITLKEIMQASPQQILLIIMDKDMLIKSFSREITKFKAQQLKSKKLIASLQQKIEKSLPLDTNTSNSFMIASEFKTLFCSFMTNTVPSVFYEFTEHPKIFALLLKSIMQSVYKRFSQSLSNKLSQIQSLLMKSMPKQQNLQNTQKSQQNQDNQSHRQQLKFHLLKYLQKYYKKVFPINIDEDKNISQKQEDQTNQNHKNLQRRSARNLFKISIQNQTVIDSQVMQKIEGLNSAQFQQTQEAKQFCLELYQICIYMILQQNLWEFVFGLEDNENQRLQYSKKQHTCIDGFIKEGKQVLFVLKGLRKKDNSDKQFHYHPNIRNFVLPSNQQQMQNLQQDCQFETEIFFLDQESKGIQIQTQAIEQEMMPLRQTTALQNQNKIREIQFLKKLDNPPILVKSIQLSGLNNFIQLKENSQENHQDKRQISFQFQAIGQTQKSQIIESLATNIQHNSMIQSQQNCIIYTSEINQLFPRKRKNYENQQNKENIGENINFAIKNDQKHLISHSKKQKSLLDKNGMKKVKKEKNNSTIDLTIQKRKISQKDCFKDHVQDEIVHKRKNEELPFTRDIPKSSKKKNPGKSSRKCSVGKIVSQSTQINGSNVYGKQRICISQHSTMVMKQSVHPKTIKENFLNQENQKFVHEKQQNLCNFIGHMYEKQIIRPKKSTKTSKHDDKPLISNINQANKQDRPLALRAYQNNNLVGKLRQKYLINN